MDDTNLIVLNQKEVFGHEDKRLLFVVGRDDNANELINVIDVREPTGRLLITSDPINDVTHEELINMASFLKKDALAILNGY